MFVANIFWFKEFIPATEKGVTLSDDFQIQGHMMLHVLDLPQLLYMLKQRICFVSNALYFRQFRWQDFARDITHISASTHAIATNLLLSLMFNWSGKSFQMLINAWPWPCRMTLKFTVTRFCKSSHLLQLLYVLWQLKRHRLVQNHTTLSFKVIRQGHA